jgi:hypothetical protein
MHLTSLFEFLEKEGHLLDSEVKVMYSKLKFNFKDFLSKLEEEGVETKQAFAMLVQATFEGKQLTHEEKEAIGNQMKDVLKTVGLVGMAALPGGSLFFILAKFLKLNKYIMPSSFLEKKA